MMSMLGRYRTPPVMMLTMGTLVFAVAFAASGCQSSAPKPMAQPSVQDVKQNADRSFDRLKQEERQGMPASPSGY
ncbi:MAG: hypothetical protein U0172_06000 [Nitrospiraceae bacterium]